MNLCRLVYKSTANININNNAALKELEHQSVPNNNLNNICGILLFSDNKFLQVLEGEEKQVKGLYSRIIKDDRHYDVEVITYMKISKLEYSDWSMKLVDLNSRDSKYIELIVQNKILMLSKVYKDAIQAHRKIKEILIEMQDNNEKHLLR